MKRFLLLCALLGVAGVAQAQTAYKLKVTQWTCTVTAGGEMVASGTVVNQSGRALRGVRVNLRVVDKQIENVNSVANRSVRGTNSAAIALVSLANGASSRFTVRVRPTTTKNVTCQIWFRSTDVVQIPTRVPELP